MVTDHRQTVKRFYRLYAIKDIPSTMDLFDPQVEMHPAENFIYATGRAVYRSGGDPEQYFHSG